MIRLIASDIDGTLLPLDTTDISPEAFSHIARLREKGILFCPASGRQYSSLRRLFAPVADQLPYLCENGAVVFGPGSPGPVLYKAAMDRSLTVELCEDILALPECEVLISGADTSYLCPKGDDFEDHVRNFVGNNAALVPSPAHVPEDIIKVSAFRWKGSADVLPLLAPKWQDHFTVAIAGRKWLDFTVTDKGQGLRHLCAALGIGLDEVLAIGDNYNDLSMLEVVGHPYLMENAAPELRGRFPTCRRVEDLLAQL